MPRINLLGGTYQARSVISDAQRCVNLFPEINPPDDADHPVTHYPTAGTKLLANGPISGVSRLMYRASNGDLYRIIAQNVYYVDSSWNHTLLGTVSLGTNICSMSDNGLVLVLVDGTSIGYAIDMMTRQYGIITSPNFYGASKANYLDTFFMFNIVNTNQWYISLSNVTFDILTGPIGGLLTADLTSGGTTYVDGTYTTVALIGGTGSGAQATITVVGGIVTNVVVTSPGINYLIGDVLSASNADLGGSGSGFAYTISQISGAGFDALDIASKTGSPDPIVTIIVIHTEIWLIGTLTTEIWYNSGAADFTFQRLPGSFVEHGIGAFASAARMDLSIYWLAQDREGKSYVVSSEGYSAKRISTFAMENALVNYGNVTDAIGYTYQQGGHFFYILIFPSAQKTWCYDRTSGLWHERNWMDTNGILYRHRGNCCAFAYGYNVIGDYQNGNLLAFDTNTYSDWFDGSGPYTNGSYPIPRIRAFPHLLQDDHRVMYRNFIADIAPGSDDGSLDGTSETNPPLMTMRFSDNRGKSYGNGIQRDAGSTGQYIRSLQWNRLGMARDRVFELSWSFPAETALQGAFINVEIAAT